MSIIAEFVKYTLPSYLVGILTPAAYNKWLTDRSRILLWRDQKHRKPYAASATKAEYRSLIHDAVMRNGQTDPYTGDALDWTLIGEWKDTKELRDVFEKKFALMPTVDHIDPEKLGFEICSMLVNFCKTDLRPDEFICLCGKVVAFRTVPKPAMWKPVNPDSRFKKFLLPPFLSGTMTVWQYNNWLDAKAHKLFVRDKKRGKAFAFSATQARYKELIHAAAQAGQFDPYTHDARSRGTSSMPLTMLPRTSRGARTSGSSTSCPPWTTPTPKCWGLRSVPGWSTNARASWTRPGSSHSAAAWRGTALKIIRIQGRRSVNKYINT